MVNVKPLPALPVTSLSVEAHAHRGRLIKHFLHDTHEPEIESNSDGWLYVLEEALDSFTSECNRREWLQIFRRKHEASRPQPDAEAQGLAEKPLPAMPQTPFQQLRKLVARRLPVDDDKHVGQLVLCISPQGSSVPLPAEDGGFALLPANLGCSFTANTFILHEPDQNEPDGSVLYGLEYRLDDECYIVGGSFAFNGITSPTQYHLLRKVLRMAIYIHLALILEQCVLSDLGIQLKLARPRLPIESPSIPTHPTSEDTKDRNTSQQKPRSHRNSIILSSFTNFFLKRSLSYRRSQTISQTPERSGASLDLKVMPPSLSAEESPSPRRSIEGAVHGIRLRRLSFLGDRRASIWKSQAEPVTTNPVQQPFAAAVKRIEDSESLLSTSPGIILPVPKLITELAEKESRNGSSKWRLKGDERVALTSFLGWDGKDAEGKGMSGIVGFVRQQEISFLCSTHVPVIPIFAPGKSQSILSLQQGPASKALASESNASVLEENEGKVQSADFSSPTSLRSLPDKVEAPQNGLHHCEKPRWKTYRYFAFRDGEDTSLGLWIRDTAAKRSVPCNKLGCAFLQGQHERRFVHDGVRIVIKISEMDATSKASDSKEVGDEVDQRSTQPSSDSFEQIMMWYTCAVCHAVSPRTRMSDGAYLFSFAKYLELLVYSPMIFTLTPPVCEHTTPSPSLHATLPLSRFNILWNFFTGSTQIVFSLSQVEDIFELKLPRLQITRGGDRPAPPLTVTEKSGDDIQKQDDVQKKALRKEIKRWWEYVSDHLDKIEMALGSGEPTYKSLPRLPSADSAYDIFQASDTYSGSITPRISTSSKPPPVPFPTPVQKTHSYFSIETTASSETETPGESPVAPPASDPVEAEKLLVSLRRNFQQVEQSLYAQLGKTPTTSLNDVRRAFLATGVGSRNRLRAWQKKHLGQAKDGMVGELQAEEPAWWGKGFHVVPGCNILVRENDWCSIIAHTLSTVDYQMELANLSIARTGSAQTSPASPVTEATATSSFFSVASGYKLFVSPLKQHPDPDQEDVAVWSEPEPYSAVISRKENPREILPLLSIRDVLRSKNSGDQQDTSSSANSSRFSSLTGGNTPSNPPPSSIKTKPDIALNIQAVDGESITDGEYASKVLQELENSAVASSRHTSRPGSVISEHVTDALPSSTQPKDRMSVLTTSAGNGEDSRRTVKQKDFAINSESASSVKPNLTPPPLPPKNTPKALVTRHTVSTSATSSAPSAWHSTNNPSQDSPSSHSSRLTSTIASGLQTAMRFVMKSEPSVPPSLSSGSTIKKQHTLLGDITHTDGRPHIKYDWTTGKRMKFSCTVYYAKQFDLLRKRCGLHEVFLKSMSISTSWTAEGGKSRSNFWKTEDDRFIIKTLVNAWNVSDLQVLLDFAPAYFRYMDATTSKPTILCKILGFYTVEIRNLETGTAQAKSDLLVMENLFFDHMINKTFDLKGIQGRRVKSRGDTTKTLFDGEWIEGQQRTLTLVRPHSKVILRESVRSDTEFLAKSNIMDYSLLLGVDDQKKEIFCGLVDTIGSYTFAKTLEYKAKHGLQSTEVTVMPPNEYQERFVNALDGYFLACPDKWSKPQEESKVVSDPNHLPSVL